MNVNKLNSACDRTREDWFHNERKGKAGGEIKRFAQTGVTITFFSLYSVSQTLAFDLIH